MGSCGHSGVVQPHDGFTLANIKSALPVLVNLNATVTGLPWGISPKLWLSVAKVNTGASPWAFAPTNEANTIKKLKTTVFITVLFLNFGYYYKYSITVTPI